MKKNRHSVALHFFGFLFLFSSLLALNIRIGSAGHETHINYQLNQQELVNFTKPSVVRIVQHIKGEATIFPFNLDFKNLTINPIQNEEPLKIPIDDYYTGSGFIVSPNGYIMTNSHVVSYQTAKLKIISNVALLALAQKAQTITESESEEITQDQDKLEEFGKKIGEYLLSESKFDIKKELNVLSPASKSEELDDLLKESFPATVISVNDNFYKDNKDVAIIKINQTNLPYLSPGDSSQIKAGEKIYVFGFPSTAEFNRKDLLESTFTQGIISAFKDAADNNFKLIQTDAKISQGSSGSPLLNEKGEVIGVITYQTGTAEKDQGDNFAFAVPIETAREAIKTFKVSEFELPTEAGNFNDHFRDGIYFVQDKKCQKALAQFEFLKEANSQFQVQNNIKPFIEKCDALTASGQSIDTKWDEIKNEIKNMKNSTWYLIGGGIILLIILSIVIIFLVKKLRSEEKRLKKDEDELSRIENNLSQLNNPGPAQIIPSPESPKEEINILTEQGVQKIENSQPIQAAPAIQPSKNPPNTIRPIQQDISDSQITFVESEKNNPKI
jgi:S1-C subfamily serine protease